MHTCSPQRNAARPEGPSLTRMVATDDVDCLAGSISGWTQRYEQLNRGNFCGHLAELCFGTTQVFLEHTNLALRQTCTVPAGHVWFGLPLSDARTASINGVSIQHGRIALHKGGSRFELSTPDNLSFWGIVVREDSLLAYARQFEHEAWLDNALRQPVLKADERTIRAAQDACNEILHSPPAVRNALESSPVNRSLTEHALRALFAVFQTAAPVAPDRISDRQRQRLVERVDGYVRANSDRLVPVAELCTTLSISRRALQTSFQDVLGISPHAYIRAISLNGVRGHLKDSHSPYSSIQDAAAAFGFWHMSQFAQDYRQLFGERPSDTFKRRMFS
jgi:AraC family transcriptional regulator, ethanolamine operon transcriptional activator